MAKWHCHIDGNQYGPVDEEQLIGWIREGRVQAGDLVWQEGMAEWQPASSVAALRSLFAVDPLSAMSGSDKVPPPPGARKSAKRKYEPHRGGAILALGILGLLVCFICGIIAWTMANDDLRKMSAKRMDPAGRGNTEAGRICGMISVILACLGALVWVIAIVGTAL